MTEKWYRITQLPDLTLNKYSSLEDNGIDGVLGKHIAFLRQLNRKGVNFNLSFHLFYLYLSSEDLPKDIPGERLQAFILVRGDMAQKLDVDAFMDTSSLSEFFTFDKSLNNGFEEIPCSLENVLKTYGMDDLTFKNCSFLTKAETYLPSDSGSPYYMIRDWEMNEKGRLYSMFRAMESMNKTALYRVDLYPTEESEILRKDFKLAMNRLHQKQDDFGSRTNRDYEGFAALDNYESLLKTFENSPHFIANIMVFSQNKEVSLSLLDAAGSESLLKGKYQVASFDNEFNSKSFLDDEIKGLINPFEKRIVKKGKLGLVICREESQNLSVNYLPTLFTLENIAPFFRMPVLYEGEAIQIPKETAPAFLDGENAIYLGKDKHEYDVNFPTELFPKHAFIAGVPGSGKTNIMHHLTSSLWKKGIPFLVLEPAKQEYRALLNDEEMKDVYLFAPNADMSFPLHINPFELPKGMIIAEHIRKLCEVFEGAFYLFPPLPFLLDTAIETIYKRLGWDPSDVYTGNEKDGNGKSRPFPTMSMLYEQMEKEIQKTKYDSETGGNIESALKVRIGSLLRREMGDVFDVPVSTFPPEKWLEVPAIIELESMGTGPANFLNLLLCTLIRETLKVNPDYDKGSLRHVIFIEEAHNLICSQAEDISGEDANPKVAATNFIVKMLAEVRALKEGIVIADQLPSAMAPEVLKNTGLKLGLRITANDDRSYLGNTMSASSVQLEKMATFKVGEALVFYEGLLKPFEIQTKEWFGEIEDKNLKKEMVTSKSDRRLREMLSDNKAYRETIRKSVYIIHRKYNGYRLSWIERFEEFEKKFIFRIISYSNKLNEIDRKLNSDLELTEDELDILIERREDLRTSLEIAMSDKKAIEEARTLISDLGRYIKELETFKNNKCSKMKLENRLYVGILELQQILLKSAIKFCETMNNFFKMEIKEIEQFKSLYIEVLNQLEQHR